MGVKAKTKEIADIQYFYQLTVSEVNLASVIKDSFRYFIREELAKKCG